MAQRFEILGEGLVELEGEIARRQPLEPGGKAGGRNAQPLGGVEFSLLLHGDAFDLRASATFFRFPLHTAVGDGGLAEDLERLAHVADLVILSGERDLRIQLPASHLLHRFAELAHAADDALEGDEADDGKH